MGSSSSKLYGALIVLAYMTSFLLAATSVLAAPSANVATTPDIAPAEQSSDTTLKLHGTPRLDPENDGNSPLTDVQDESADLGDTTEWEDPLNNIGRTSFETIHYNPAYDEDSNIDGGISNLAVGLQGQYHPTWWMPDTLAPNPGGAGNGLWDVNDDAIMDYRQIDDEDFDSSIDTDQTDDTLDLAGHNDNVPDVWARNDDASEGDYYHSAMVWAYEWTGYTSTGTQANIGQGDDIVFPTAGIGGDPGLDSLEAVPGDGDVSLEVDTSSNGNDADGDSGNEWFRLETEQISVDGQGGTASFWDFQIEVESVDDTSGAGEDTARVRVHWLGDYDNPDEVQSGTVTVDPDDLVGAERTARQIDSDDNCRNQDKPTDGSPRFWYFCVDGVTPSDSGAGSIDVRMGRVFADRGNSPEISSVLADGAFYSVAELRMTDNNDDDGTAGEGDEDDPIEVVRIEQVVPLGDNLEFEGLDATLQGVAAGDDFAFPHPFNAQHEYLTDNDVEADTNEHDFLRDVDTGQRAEGSGAIDADDIDLTEDYEDAGDRSGQTRDALSVTWQREGREPGLLAHRLQPNGANDDFQKAYNNVYPNHYVEVMPGDTAVVQSSLMDALEGFRFFTWDPSADNEVLFHNPMHLFGDDLNDANGDTVSVAPAFQTEGDTEAGGDPANTLTELDLRHDPHTIFDDRDNDDNVDFNPFTDEEFSTNTENNAMDQTDGDDIKDEAGDNLFDLEDPNDDFEEGDITAPTIRQDYTYRWIDAGTDNPVSAAIGGDVDGDDIGSGTSKLVLSVASEHDGAGLTSADIDGDGQAEETFVVSREAGQDLDNDGANGAEVDGGEGGFTLVRFESEQLALQNDDRASFFGFDVEVTGIDDDNDQVDLEIFKSDEAQETNDDVATFNNVGTGTPCVGVAMDWRDGRTTAVGPQGNDGTDCLQAADGDNTDPDFDFFVQVVSVSGTTANIIVGHYLPVDENTQVFADGHMYALTGAPLDGADLQDLTVTTWTPLGGDVEVADPNLTVEGLQSGGTLDLFDPYDRDHQVVNQVGSEADEDEFGFLTSDDPDDDHEFDDRLIDVGPLDITVDGHGSWDNSFIWLDSTEVDGSGHQLVNGIFTGTEDFDQGTPADAGFPTHDDGGSFQDVPDTSADGGISRNLAGGFDDPIPNDQRGTLGYAEVTIPPGHGTHLLESGRLGADLTDDGAIDSVRWVTSAGGDADRIDTGGATGWLMFDSTDRADLWVGDGTGPSMDPCLEDPNSDACQEGQKDTASFEVASISCDPATVSQGGAIECTATVDNTGSASGSSTVTLRRTHVGSHETDRFTAQATSSSTGVGNSATVDLVWQTQATTTSGDYELTAETDTTDVTKSTTVTVEEVMGAQISVQSCSVSGSIQPGGTATGQATFENTGDASGSDTFNVQAGGDGVGSVSSGTVAAGDTKQLTISVTIPTSTADPSAGGDDSTVSVLVGGVSCSGQITVKASQDGDGDGDQQPTIPGFETVAMLAAVGAALVLLRRRD